MSNTDDFITEELARRKATVHTLLNATSDLALIIDLAGTILEIGEAAANRVGKSPDQIIGTIIYDHLPEETRDVRKAYVLMVAQSGQSIRFEFNHDDITLLVGIFPIVKSDGSIDSLAIFIADSTALIKKEALLYRYSQILSHIKNPIIYIDKQYIFRTVNDATLRLFNKTSEQVIGKHVARIVGKKLFKSEFRMPILQCLGGEKVYCQNWYNLPGERRRFMYLSFYPLFARENTVSGVVVNAVDITKMKEMEEKLKFLSETDQLTQIFNRIKFHGTLLEEIIRIRRYNANLSLIMFDIDFFKNVNDTYGHDVGDYVLVALTRIVKGLIRETDIFCRWGGEEFMILLTETKLEDAAKLAEKIRRVIGTSSFRTVGTVTCSFGVTDYVEHDDPDSFIKRVDTALYRAKDKGRNMVVGVKAHEITIEETESKQ